VPSYVIESTRVCFFYVFCYLDVGVLLFGFLHELLFP